MRKTIVTKEMRTLTLPERDWLDLEELAEVEISSEAEGFSIESAFRLADGPGWLAADPGEQTIRLLFDAPLRVRHVRLVFRESEESRTQEFVLRWSDDEGRTFREIVRQQYNFSPPDAICETEEYDVDLAGVTMLELTIVPDISGGAARASIAQFRIASL